MKSLKQRVREIFCKGCFSWEYKENPKISSYPNKCCFCILEDYKRIARLARKFVEEDQRLKDIQRYSLQWFCIARSFKNNKCYVSGSATKCIKKKCSQYFDSK